MKLTQTLQERFQSGTFALLFCKVSLFGMTPHCSLNAKSCGQLLSFKQLKYAG